MTRTRRGKESRECVNPSPPDTVGVEQVTRARKSIESRRSSRSFLSRVSRPGERHLGRWLGRFSEKGKTVGGDLTVEDQE